MSWGISASPSSVFQLKINTTQCSTSSFLLVPPTHLKLRILHGAEFARFGGLVKCSRNDLPGGGDNGSKSVLDAFFLGKALAEAINERVESSVGELLSTVGRLQAEQQKIVQEFQDEVLERAKKSKEKAAREAMEAQGNTLNESISQSATDIPSEVVAVEVSPSSSSEQINNSNYNDPLLGMMMDDD